MCSAVALPAHGWGEQGEGRQWWREGKPTLAQRPQTNSLDVHDCSMLTAMWLKMVWASQVIVKRSSAKQRSSSASSSSELNWSRSGGRAGQAVRTSEAAATMMLLLREHPLPSAQRGQ